MNYENWCSRSNPGHIIIVVDQNEYMGEVSSGGLTLAQRMATLVNRFISQIVMECWQGKKILRCTKITIIGYGGINSGIQVIYDTYIDILADDEKIPVDKLQTTVSDGQGRFLKIDYDLKRFIEPVAIGCGKVCDAFRKVKSLIIAEIAFSKTDSIQDKPVPVILHFSANTNMGINDECVQIVESIKRISLPDGNPIIMNCIFTNDESCHLCYPLYMDNIPEASFKMSSFIPNTYIYPLQYLGFQLLENCKALVVNPKSDGDLYLGIIQFGGSEPYIIRYHNCL